MAGLVSKEISLKDSVVLGKVILLGSVLVLMGLKKYGKKKVSNFKYFFFKNVPAVSGEPKKTR